MSKKYILMGLTAFFMLLSQETHAASKHSLVVNSIVQRPDGVSFSISVDGGPPEVVTAPRAQSMLERTCPSVRFAPGVMQ